MIKDIPTEAELESAALDLLVMAWEAALETMRTIRRSAIEEWDTDGSARADYDIARQPTLRHAHVWIHQAQELGLKARIVGVSPYLLLIGDPRSWPKSERDGSVSFSDLRTIDASDLVRVHDTVCLAKLPADFVRRFEQDRRNRNKIVHLGGHGFAADARDLILRILETAETLFPSRMWAAHRLEAAFNGGAAILNSDAVEWGLLMDFDILVEVLKPAELRRHFNYDARRRGYICLSCSSEQGDWEDPSRFAQLVSPDGDDLFCPVCTVTRKVLRNRCSAAGCRNDVLWAEDYKIGTCLICADQNDKRYEAQPRAWLARSAARNGNEIDDEVEQNNTI